VTHSRIGAGEPPGAQIGLQRLHASVLQIGPRLQPQRREGRDHRLQRPRDPIGRLGEIHAARTGGQHFGHAGLDQGARLGLPVLVPPAQPDRRHVTGLARSSDGAMTA